MYSDVVMGQTRYFKYSVTSAAGYNSHSQPNEYEIPIIDLVILVRINTDDLKFSVFALRTE